MTAFRHIRDLFAALLCAALLLLAGAAQAQTIDNTARAQWTRGSQSFTMDSNLVSIAVTQTAAILDTFRPSPAGGTILTFNPSDCGGQPVLVGNLTSGTLVASAATATTLRIGDALFFRLIAPTANLNPAEVDNIVTVLTTSNGDREQITVFETSANSGVFIGALPTSAVPPQPVLGDCRLSVAAGDLVSIECLISGQSVPIATAVVNILADPFGLVLDSQDGSPVNGARVSLVDALTGAPAQVFGDDGVTPYPSVIYSGQMVTDSAGNTYLQQPGEYRFPFAPIGQYRVVVEPPAPYSAPSIVAPAQLASLTRPGGQPMLISPGSYGGVFQLSSPAPVRIDIPVDRPVLAVGLSKTASRFSAMPGDVVFYTLTVTNSDIISPKRQVVLTDTPSRWLRLRKDTIRIDGVAAPAAITIAADGRQLLVALGDLAPGTSRTVTYAMTVRADAPPGQAINRVVAVDSRGQSVIADAVVWVDRETIDNRMTIIGRILAGDCATKGKREGLAGVRVMMEDGSFAITDIDGRYHFEGVVPGTHVVQAQAATLLEGAQFVDCSRSTRSARSPSSRFVRGFGGSLMVANFSVRLSQQTPAKVLNITEVNSDRVAAGAETDWLALGNGPIDFLFPSVDHNPRAPAVRVVIRHRVGQKVELSRGGKPVDPISFDGARTAANGAYAVSIWRGVPLDAKTSRLTAVVRNADGTVAAQLARDVHFSSQAARVELIPGASVLEADGATSPVIAVRILDRAGRPVHAGISGQFTVNAPYESAQSLASLQSRALSGLNQAEPTWTVKGDDGIAYVELAPTMVSGALHLEFVFADGEVRRRQSLDGWIVPGDQKWTLVGLAEGSVGAQSVADNMQRKGRFDSDLGEHARVAFYAKGRVLGRLLLTASYDSAKQRDDQRLLAVIDPRAYYTVFADGSDRRFDAASRKKLYVRIESAAFYALYGDFETGFDQTQLARYQRTATGVKAEARSGGFHATAFAAKIASSHRRDEIQGGGISGPYRLSSRAIIANSEHVTIEVRDRFRSELIIERRSLTRFLDYDIDMISGTISFKQPILSRDSAQNPQFIVIDYEIDALSGGSLNAGLRGDYTIKGGALRIGASLITDKGDGSRTDLGAIDIKARLGSQTELRAETSLSRRDGEDSNAWLLEVEHHDGKLDVLAYARSVEEGFGLGQQNGAERGRRKVGVDARYNFTDSLSITGSTWHDNSLTDASNRDALQLRGDLRLGKTDARIAITNFSDRLADGRKAGSTVLEGGVTQRSLDNRLELEASSSIALDKTESIDLPARHRLGARYSITSNVKLVANYEISDGDVIHVRTARVGFEFAPWGGARIISSIGQQSITEQGKRSFAAFGLAQSVDVTSRLTIDASLDSSRRIGGFDPARIINPDHPVASGGNLGENGARSEDFTAITLGAAYRAGRWSATMRGEWRDGQQAERKGLTFGAIRQLGEGSMIGTGFAWTGAKETGGATTEVFDGAIAAAHRPSNSPFAFLTKVEFRSDKVTGPVAGNAGPAGQTGLLVSGDAQSRRLIGSFSANWSPEGRDDDLRVQRSEIAVFTGIRYNFDQYQGLDLAGVTVLGGLDARIGIGEKFELGAVATVRSNFSDHTTSFAIGPQIGFSPSKDVLLTVGYNVTGFRDRDFAAARNTDKGVFAALRMKFDPGSLSFLGLGR